MSRRYGLGSVEMAAMLTAMSGVAVVADDIKGRGYSSYGAAQECIAAERSRQQREIETWNAAVDDKKAERQRARNAKKWGM